MRYTLLGIFLFASCFVAAQQEGEVSAYPGSPTDPRSKYIRSYPDHFFIWPVLKQRKFDFEMKSLESSKRTLQYKSNKPYSFGLGMYLFELGFEFVFAVPLEEQSRMIFGESKARDMQLNVLGKKWGADLFFQRYSGFYIDDPENPVPANTPYIQRPDIVTRSLGMTVNYTLNSNKFSFRSAYNFVERQLSSAGSLVVFASIDHILAKADSAIIGKDYLADFGESSTIDHLRSINLGIAPGYTYSLIFKGFFINGVLAIGPTNNWMKSELEGGGTETRFRLSVFVATRIALGYNGDKFFGGLTFLNQGRNVKLENIQFANSQSSFKILIGFRFRESGILKKRIWDLPKSLRN
jgi:hypothetical protein